MRFLDYPPPVETDSGEPRVISVSNVTQPDRTVYYVGDIFDPQGVTFDATWLIDGQETTTPGLDFGMCDDWTYNNEPLPSGVDKITFEIYGYSFDVSITVKEVTGAEFIIDSSAIKSEYSTEEFIDLTSVKAYLQQQDGTTTPVPSGSYKIFDNGTEVPEANRLQYSAAEGEHTFAVRYLEFEKTFTVNVVDASKVISPYHIQAEDTIYAYGESGEETTNRPKDTWRLKNYTQYTLYESYMDRLGIDYSDMPVVSGTGSKPARNIRAEGSDSNNIASGAEGKFAEMPKSLNGTYFYKFEIYVPADGDYDLLARAQTTNTTGYDLSARKSFRIKVDDGEFASATGSEDIIQPGNQNYVRNEADTGIEFSGPNWQNTFFWSVVKLSTVTLTEGTHTITLDAEWDDNVNVDYFAFEKSETDETEPPAPAILNEREGQGVLLGENDSVYIEKGTKLGDIVGIPETNGLDHYTLLYLRVYRYKDNGGRIARYTDIPVTEEMISGLDYKKTGVQAVTVTYQPPAGGSPYTVGLNVTITEPLA